MKILLPTDFSECAAAAEAKWAEETLEKRSADLRRQGIKTSWRATSGVPFEEIVSIVLLGSVTERVIRLAPCPVLTVRQPERSR